jgi:twitching motility protein PilT
MAQIDQFISFMLKQQALGFVVPSDRNCFLQRPSGPMPVQRQLSASQIQTIVQEIAPPEIQQQLNEDGTVQFPYQSDAGTFDVSLERANGSLQLTIASKQDAKPTSPPATVSAPPPPVIDAPIPLPPPDLGVVVQEGGKQVEHMDELFLLMKELEASDTHVSSNQKPMMRIHGVMRHLEQYRVNTPAVLKDLLWAIMPDRNRQEWDERWDTDFAYHIPGFARFRCNIFADRHGIGGVFRLIPSDVWTVEQMGLPKAMTDLCWMSKGLVIITGPTGCGKTTTLGALLDYCNKNRTEHIITIEDPIEFVHENIRCLINQRQVHEHTRSFSTALRAGLREDPDIILVAELRDLETTELAIHCAETGHLVFATLHTQSAPSTVDRVIDQFPHEQQEQIRTMLSQSLKGVISQILVRTKDGRRRVAFEILLIDSACANLIREGKTFQLLSMMQVGKARGCVTMSDALFALVKEGIVDPKVAYMQAIDKIGFKQLLDAENIVFSLDDIVAE